MKIKELLCPVLTGYEVDIDKTESILFNDLMIAINRNIAHLDYLHIYFSNPDSRYKEFNIKWDETIRPFHKVKTGYSIHNLFVKHLPSFTLENYIKDTYGWIVRYGNRKEFMNYSYDKFLNISRIAVAMLFAKYEKVYKFEVRTVIIQTLFEFFNVIDQYYNQFGENYSWKISTTEILKVIETIENTNVDEISKLISIYKMGDSKITVKSKPTKKKQKPLRPKNREELLKLFDEDDTTQYKVSVMMEYYVYPSETAALKDLTRHQLRRKYDNTKRIEKAISKSTEEISDKIDYSTNEIIKASNDNINLSTYTINENIDNVKQQIDTAFSELKDNNSNNTQHLVYLYKDLYKQITELKDAVTDIQNSLIKQQMLNHDLADKASRYDDEHREVIRLKGILNANHIRY